MSDQVLVAIIMAISNITVAFIANIIGKYSANKKNNNNCKSLTTHTIFTNFSIYMTSIEMMDLKFENTGRGLLASDFLKVWIQKWQDPCKIFAEDVDLNIKNGIIDNNLLYDKAIKILETDTDFNKIMKIYNLSPEDAQTFNIFKTRFIIWERELIKEVIDKIHDVATTYNYDSYRSKAARILEVIEDYIRDTIDEMGFNALQLNGELTGKTYRGYTL